MTINEQIVSLTKDIFINNPKAISFFFEMVFTDGGSTSNGRVIYDDNIITASPDREVVKILRDYFNEVKNNSEKKFNKVEFEIYKDGSYKANYYWDEGIIDEQKRKKNRYMAGWLAQRIPAMISYQGYALYDQFRFGGDILNNEDDSNEYGNLSGWRNGVFTFDFRNKEIKIIIEVEKATGRVSIPLEYKDWFLNDLLEHYEITNKGILKNEWKPWNVLEIKLEKDVEHNGGKNIEPEITYMLT